MKILSIVVTHNALRNDWLYKCIDSLMSSESYTDIIVIDNASSDETCAVIKQKYPTLVLIENKLNKGFGAANNQGFEYGLKHGTDFFFLLNQDAWIDRNCLRELVDVCIENKDFAVISPLHLNGKANALDYNFSNYIAPRNCPNLYSDLILNKEESKIYEINFVNAAAWLLPIKSLEIVGGFSPAFFHYGEDDNYCQRIFFHKLKIGVYPFVKIYHDREDRPIIKSPLLDKHRLWSSKYSNPLSNFNYKNRIKFLKVNLLKNRLVRRLEKATNNRDELTFLQTNFPQIDLYNLESKTSKPYKFLKI